MQIEGGTTQVIINQIIILFLLMSVGGLARKKGLLNDTIASGLSGILMHIALPALIVVSFIFDFSPTMLRNGILVFGISVIIHGILFLLNKLAFGRYHFDKRNVFILSGVFPNVGYMGMPFIYAVFGQIGVFYAAIFSIPYTLLLFTYGQDMFRKEKVATPLLTQIIAHSKKPTILAVAAGMIMFLLSFKLPYTVVTTLSSLGGLTLPIAMMLVGNSIAQMKIRNVFSDKDVYYGTIVRLILIPVVTYGVLHLCSVDATIVNVCVTIEALPMAVAGVIFAQMYEGDTSFASKCVVIQHALSLITIPLILIIFN